MTILNISLCLPAPDIKSIQTQQSIVAVTKRFLAPGKSFALLPCQDFPGSQRLETIYQKSFLDSARSQFEQSTVTHWASCVSCQPMSEESQASAIAQRTIWTEAALHQHLESTQGKTSAFFISVLRVYALEEPLHTETAPACEQLYKFVPLPECIHATEQSPVWSDEEFVAAKEHFLAPEDSTSAESSIPAETQPASIEEILEGSDWAEQISAFGNSRDGHSFEKLVRKALIELGFSNSLSRPEASLDPYATGGAGGIDFYANQPYSLVGECKATATDSVGGDPATQLHKLGLKYLSQAEYESAAQLIVAAGKITSHSNKIAVGHKMNVIRPETLQDLVILKMKHTGSIEATDLAFYLKHPPFGTEADSKISGLIQQWKDDFRQNAQYIQQRRQIIQSIQELATQTIHKTQKAFSPVEIRAHHNAKFQPSLTDETVQEMLAELASPIAGYLSCKQLPNEEVRFSFVKEMPNT